LSYERHGMTSTPTYLAWRGIWLSHRKGDVDPSWITFPTFLRHMKEKPEGLALVRVNPHQPFGPRNCIWATKSVGRQLQALMVHPEANLYDKRIWPTASKILGSTLCENVIWCRIRRGRSLEGAINQSTRKRNELIQCYGLQITRAALARRLGAAHKYLNSSLRVNDSVEYTLENVFHKRLSPERQESYFKALEALKKEAEVQI
jgi:hypothetical protein